MPPYITPDIEAALVNAASAMTVEFIRSKNTIIWGLLEKDNGYLDEQFVAYYFRNILSALRRNYIEDIEEYST
ncbi:hypothetical protein K6W36_12465 [Acetobacter senegalensis]|uniref:hypothetical protein n=1 Tax=Acetobacter senegalensis TaxID=446692 RepID=UPI001EDB1736|nr:hypothetical protein [Acetobacter senegalensis]MCG4261379.1 hypothetical protein [Acetobacter senegalensis]